MDKLKCGIQTDQLNDEINRPCVELGPVVQS